MKHQTLTPKNSDLSQYNLNDVHAHWNLSPKELQRITIEKGMGKETNESNYSRKGCH